MKLKALALGMVTVILLGLFVGCGGGGGTTADGKVIVTFSTWAGAGEAKEITLHTRPEQTCLYDEEGHPMPHTGVIELYVGGGQPDSRTKALLGASPLKVVV